MSGAAALADFRLAYEISPIYLTNGIAGSTADAALPLASILNQATGASLDDYFAHFQPAPGATIVDNQISQYPFANQAVAANALIAQPLQISMQMICPARPGLGFQARTGILLALKSTLDKHNQLGGTYTVLTPSAFYTNCILAGMRDVSTGESLQRQHTWQMDFIRPLLTLEEAADVANNMMSKLQNGAKVTDSSWSSSEASVGQPGVKSTTPSSPVSHAGANIDMAGLSDLAAGAAGPQGPSP
jgi:hypothetical protein